MSGKAKIWVEVHCHECGKTGPGHYALGSAVNIRALRKEAERLDWRQRTSGDFECPSCTAEAMKWLEAQVAKIYPEKAKQP